jgi:surface protein
LNQPIDNWNVSSVTTMQGMFNGATAFNQPIGKWNTSKVTSMMQMFLKAASFNQPIGDWNVSSVTVMQGMFYGTPFNQPIGDWDVSAVTGMTAMFKEAASFNQPIGDWDVSSVKAFDYMFERASTFNQDLGKWSISVQASVDGMFTWSDSLSLANRKKIHAAFSSNPNWTYDWATFYRPFPQALSAQAGADLNYTFNGKILATGGMPVTGVAFELADNMLFQKAQTHPAALVDGNFSVSLILEAGKRYYYRAVATNEVGTNRSGPKRLVTPNSKTYWWSDSSPQAGGWRTSRWFGTFLPYENGWIYHAKVGWAYAHSDGSGGLWLWMKDHRWMWTQSGVYPYIWKNADGSWHYLLGTQNGQPVFYEWRGASSSAGKP